MYLRPILALAILISLAANAAAFGKIQPASVGDDGEILSTKRPPTPGKRAFTLYKDGSPKFVVLEWNPVTENALTKLKEELPRSFGSKAWDTIRYMNGTVITTEEELLASDYYIVSAGHHFLYAPLGRGNENIVKVDRTVKLTSLELKPRIFQVDNLVSKEEAEYMYFFAQTHSLPLEKPTSRKQQIVFKDGLPYRFGDAIFDRVLQRVTNFSRAWGHMMEPQIWRYHDTKESGVFWGYEQDQRFFAHRAARRVATLLIFLNTIAPENGGDVVFPHTMSEFRLGEKMNEDYLADICRGGVLKPIRFKDFSARGKGLMIYTINENERINTNAETDERSEYIHCPVKGQEKWVVAFSWYNKPIKIYNASTTELPQAFTEFDPVANKLSEEFFHHLYPQDLLHVVDPQGENGWNEAIIKGVRKFYPGSYALPLFDPSTVEAQNAIYSKPHTLEGLTTPEEFKDAEEKARVEHLKELERFYENARKAEAEAEEHHKAEVAADAKAQAEQKDEL